jgi:hypothetical protein
MRGFSTGRFSGRGDHGRFGDGGRDRSRFAGPKNRSVGKSRCGALEKLVIPINLECCQAGCACERMSRAGITATQLESMLRGEISEGHIPRLTTEDQQILMLLSYGRGLPWRHPLDCYARQR